MLFRPNKKAGVEAFVAWFEEKRNVAALTTDGYTHGRWEVTADIADHLLKNHNEGNRPLDPKNVRVKIRLLESGQFRITSQGVSISNEEHPRINDGQHRLEAIRQSGISATMQFCFGEPRANFSVLDTNMKVRTAADVVAVSDPNHPHHKLLSAAAILFMKIKEGSMGMSYTPEDVLAIFDLAPQLKEATAMGGYLGRKLGNWGTKTAFVVALTMIQQDSNTFGPKLEEALKTFCDRVADGAELPKRSPILVLRDGITQDRIGAELSGTAKAAAMAAAVISTWNGWAKNKPCGIRAMAWTPGEAFPVAE